MTDKELLELAYKALMSGADLNDDKDMLKRWNPLTDDGDALRLAVKLRIKFRYNEALGQALAWTGGVNGFEAQANIEDCLHDENACARRAIVRAAAEIGANT